MAKKTTRLSDYVENPDNPSVATDEDIRRLAGKIKRVPLGLTAMRIAYVTDRDGDERTLGKRVVISGNKRLRVLKAAYGEDGEVPAEWFADVTAMSEAERHEFIVSANVSDGEWDVDKLLAQYDKGELAELMKADELDALLDGIEETATEGETDEDAVPETPTEPKSERGKVYQLGRHRVMCGDSTKAEDIDILLGGDFARMTVTSPPYGVGKDYEEKGVESWRKTISGVIEAIKGKSLIICWNIADLFSTGTQFTEPTGAYSIELMSRAGYGMLYNRIWHKPGANFAGNNPYYTVTTKPAQDYEYLYAFAENDYERHLDPIKQYLFECAKQANITNDIIKSIGGPSFMYGHWFTEHQWTLIDESNYKKIQSYCVKKRIDAFCRDYSSVEDEYKRNTIFSHSLTDDDFSSWGLYGVWEFDTVHQRLGGHAAAFPLELPTRFIKMHSYDGDVVLDPFGGTGTTLIACEQLNRRARLMELDPRYCDVIRRRWAEFVHGEGCDWEKLTPEVTDATKEE